MLHRIADYFNIVSFGPISREECEKFIIVFHVDDWRKVTRNIDWFGYAMPFGMELSSYFLDFYGKDAIFLQQKQLFQ